MNELENLYSLNLQDHLQSKMDNEFLKQIEKAKKHLVIVEGKKDRTALENLGFTNIFVINSSGKSFPEKIEEIQNMLGKNDKASILTDLDKKGKELHDILKSEFSKLGVKTDSSFREFLKYKDISHIEGLDTFIKNKAQNPIW